MSQSSCCQGQLAIEGRTLAFVRHKADAAAVGFHARFADGETKAHAALPARRRRIGLSGSVEYPCLKTLWDPRTMVDDGHTQRAAMTLDIYLDVAAGFSELHGIRQQIVQNLLNADRIAVEHGSLGLGLDV